MDYKTTGDKNHYIERFKMDNFKWNGEPCDAQKVFVKIKNGDGFFKWWQPYVGKILEGIKVSQNNSSWVIYNGDGSGERKLLNGGGPGMPYMSFENYEIIDSDDIEVVKYSRCQSHEWSDSKVPIFKTETRYCLKCMTAKIFTEKNAQ